MQGLLGERRVGGQCVEGLEHSVEDSPCGNKGPLMFSAEKTHG